MSARAIGVAMTGASGAPYGLRLLETLVRAGEEVHLVVSDPGRMVINTETELRLPGRAADMERVLRRALPEGPGRLRVFALDDWFAPMASGSNPPRAFVVCPCTSATLAAIASGAGRSLVDRAADVALKEGRPLILVPREMPLSVIHLENMLRLARAGATIMPPSPGFYHHPRSLGDLVDFVVARILDHLRIPHALMPRWGEERMGEEGGPGTRSGSEGRAARERPDRPEGEGGT